MKKIFSFLNTVFDCYSKILGFLANIIIIFWGRKFILDMQRWSIIMIVSICFVFINKWRDRKK